MGLLYGGWMDNSGLAAVEGATMKGKMVLYYGQGGAAIEWWENGERLFKTRLEGLGLQVLLLNWDQREVAFNFLKGWGGWIGQCGDSLGAISSITNCGDLRRPVQFAGGFQPSVWDPRVVTLPNGEKVAIVPGNVIKAHCIYDPNFVDTGGLGAAHYIIQPGAKTILTTTQHPGAHPDDWGVSQDMMFNDAKQSVEAYHA